MYARPLLLLVSATISTQTNSLPSPCRLDPENLDDIAVQLVRTLSLVTFASIVVYHLLVARPT